MPNEATPTLGQRIDAVLEPLYLEAEQLRQTIIQATAQQQSLQEQIDQAEQGLGQIESRMAQVVRELARQEPIIAAVVGQAPAATVEPAGVEPSAPSMQDSSPLEAPAEAQAQPDQAPAAEPAPEALAETQLEAQPETQTQIQTASAEDADDAFFQEQPTIELDPHADAQAVGEAAALLDEAPAQAAPKVDLAAAAQRAAAAARQLRDKAATK